MGAILVETMDFSEFVLPFFRNTLIWILKLLISYKDFSRQIESRLNPVVLGNKLSFEAPSLPISPGYPNVQIYLQLQSETSLFLKNSKIFMFCCHWWRCKVNKPYEKKSYSSQTQEGAGGRSSKAIFHTGPFWYVLVRLGLGLITA